MKTSLKYTVSILTFAVLAIGQHTLADTVTGRLTTGISGNNGTTVNGVVVAPPTAAPTAGVYTDTQNVTLATDGASSIRFTVDGTVPTCSTGSLYSNPIEVSSSQVIEAISCYDGGVSSSVASYQYGINPPSQVNPDNGGGVILGVGGGVGGSISTLKGDTNGDGRVNILDFVTLMADWGKTSGPADFNRDGRVDILDFVILMSNWTN